MIDWRRIETMPDQLKDGRHLLLFTHDFGAVEGWWDRGVANFYKSQEEWASYDPDNAQGDWMSHWQIGQGEDRRLYCGATPTHYAEIQPPGDPDD